jgi:hypothetical protein
MGHDFGEFVLDRRESFSLNGGSARRGGGQVGIKPRWAIANIERLAAKEIGTHEFICLKGQCGLSVLEEGNAEEEVD